jgi:glutamine amidotransferase
MIVIVDYGMGNLRSIANAFHKIQVDAMVSSDPEQIAKADKLVVPGVGAFDEGMRMLDKRRLVPVLENRVLHAETPVLGICLGLQLLTRRSDEGMAPGLGWLAAETVALDPGNGVNRLKVPHMGWNTIEPCAGSPLLTGLPNEPSVYFAHAYHLQPDDDRIVVAETRYGKVFPAVIQWGNIFGTQFHPEKSQRAGLRVLRNFAEVQ